MDKKEQQIVAWLMEEGTEEIEDPDSRIDRTDRYDNVIISIQFCVHCGKTMEYPDGIEDTYESIERHYAGKSVFITGGTGFLGKVFVEKLLYSCPKINKIFLLLRNKNKSDISERIKQLLELPIFDRIRKEKPENLEKVVPLSGDVALPNLGMKQEDEQMLIDQVSYIFHFAANVKFNETLNVAMNINVEGTRRVLKLCQRMKNIKVFVYVSTAYSNTHKRVLEEIVYSSPASIDEVYKILEQEVTNEDKLKKLICGRPNTYTFAKALAESLVSQERGDFATIIIRPSIVSASFREPLTGWLDNWFGATALLATIAKGLNRIILSKSTNLLDLIPVDFVSNLIVAAAAKCKRSNEVTVYNSCTSDANPLTMAQFGRLITEDSVKHNFHEIICPTLFFTQSQWLLKFLTIIMQIIPCFIADCWLRLMGRPPRFMKMQRRILQTRSALQYFSSNSWQMKCQRTRDLFASLSDSDRLKFPFDPTLFKWDEYLPIYCMGIRKFLFKLSSRN
ncbi:unnamed protein product [Parnassius apollo]|uniref:Fatty acyl-CoA reductase n=1 Tax=Parnassius apollo TaxID=110799 RepID=A0A8S3X387_PARAO|nr:unnamed protein product [Parnassius apollo]